MLTSDFKFGAVVSFMFIAVMGGSWVSCTSIHKGVLLVHAPNSRLLLSCFDMERR